MKKTQLNIVINPERIANASAKLPVTVCAKSVEKWTDASGKARTARKTLASVETSTDISCAALTDFFGRYAYHIAPKLCYTALKTIYANHADEKILTLMHECLDYMHSSVDTLSDFSDYLEMKYEKDGEKTTIQEKKTHKYITVSIDGKRKRIECLPYETIEMTAYGKELFAETAKNWIGNDLDIQDLIQEAVLSVLEIVRYGLADDTFSLWSYSNYYYKRLNAYIRKNARRYNEISLEKMREKAKNDEEFASENGLFDVYTFENANLNVMKENIINYLYRKLPSRCAKDKVIKAFVDCKFGGLTTRAEAKVLDVSAMMISKYLSTAEKCLSTDEAKTFLHDMIYA